jgi:hypothetical protein
MTNVYDVSTERISVIDGYFDLDDGFFRTWEPGNLAGSHTMKIEDFRTATFGIVFWKSGNWFVLIFCLTTI